MQGFESPQSFLEWFLSPQTTDAELIRRRLAALPPDWWAAFDRPAAGELYARERVYPPQSVVTSHPEHNPAALIELKRRLLGDERQRRDYHP